MEKDGYKKKKEKKAEDSRSITRIPCKRNGRFSDY